MQAAGFNPLHAKFLLPKITSFPCRFFSLTLLSLNLLREKVAGISDGEISFIVQILLL
jgi:hypothetical protein